MIVNAYSQATTRVGSTFRDTSLFMYMASMSILKTDEELTPRTVASIVNAFARAGLFLCICLLFASAEHPGTRPVKLGDRNVLLASARAKFS